MLELLLAAAGTPTPDRPHWPDLPAVHVDAGGYAHARPDCAEVDGPAQVPDPAPDPDPAQACTCLGGLLAALQAHPAAAELGRAAALARDLVSVTDAVFTADNHLPAGIAALGADPHAALAGFDDGSRSCSTTACYLLWHLGTGTAAGARAEANLAVLPDPLRGPAAAHLDARLPELRAALAGLRRVWTDEDLNTLAGHLLDGPGTLRGHAWLFFTDTPADLAETADWLNAVWPGRVHPSPDGGKLVALLPAAVARTWLATPTSELVTADPAVATAHEPHRARGATATALTRVHVHTLTAAELAEVSLERARTALTLWQPSHGRAPLPPLHAAAALRAAAAVLA